MGKVINVYLILTGKKTEGKKPIETSKHELEDIVTIK
jgi:hypothetical protein